MRELKKKEATLRNKALGQTTSEMDEDAANLLRQFN